jgi:hypothetical protein
MGEPYLRLRPRLRVRGLIREQQSDTAASFGVVATIPTWESAAFRLATTTSGLATTSRTVLDARWIPATATTT